MSNAPSHWNATRLPVRIRRSPIACITCRARKIRCDVSVNGSPCTNCQLDGRQCIVVNSRRVRKTRHQPRPPESAPVRDALQPTSLSLDAPGSFIEYPAGVQEYLGRSIYPRALSAEMGWLPSYEVEYLSSQGALTLPRKAIIQTLLHYFFIRIYPRFPVVKESEFRESTLSQKPFSLLVFRAMLFAAAAHVPIECTQDNGYTSVAHLMFSLYKPAKALYDSGVEKDPFHLAQAALLLAYRLNNAEPMGNTTWLAVAVHNARRANAHRSQMLVHDVVRRHRLSDLKRLWWCCIMQDRIVSLACHRPLNITLDQFDPAKADYLTFEDFWDDDSEYFDTAMRGVLYQLCISHCRFVTLLSPRVMLTDETPDLLGANVCVESALNHVLEAYYMLSTLAEEHEALRENKEAAENLTVAVHIHLTSMLYIAARLSLCHRYAVLYLSRCRCVRRAPEAMVHARYLQRIVELVAATNEEMTWFATNHLVYFLPSVTRCFILFPQLFNVLWFHGHELDRDFAQPADILRHYIEYDKSYSTRFGVPQAWPVVERVPAIAVSVLAASAGASGGEHRNGFANASHLDTVKLAALIPAERLRLAKTCLLLSVALDYSFAVGEFQLMKPGALVAISRRLGTRREPRDCSASAVPSLSPPSFEDLIRARYGSETPQSTEGAEITPSPSEEQQCAHRGFMPRLSLPDAPTPSRSVASAKEDSDLSSLERFAAATEATQPSMQEWAPGQHHKTFDSRKEQAKHHILPENASNTSLIYRNNLPTKPPARFDTIAPPNALFAYVDAWLKRSQRENAVVFVITKPEEALVRGGDSPAPGLRALKDPVRVAGGGVDFVPPAQADEAAAGDVLEVVEVCGEEEEGEDEDEDAGRSC
ncbi:Zn(II)2Cys6 transcription factor [Aspergillus mulundensis]|uniref:Zn(2)-C6 fungal-type domain-containing protein n=1 Tax=Aspergillus mulundensis TaxID=1810919 RepID=A0A3D8T6P3_9EURO|nr:hypothetical protein DSM5745_01537 [Aspergillus mulundensis]RDW94215.1 hypothetical protein DSM5745_01537 [Aspergillus mulundensis]